MWLKRWTPTTTNRPQTHPRHFSQALPEAEHHVRCWVRVQNGGRDWWSCSTQAVHLLLSSPQAAAFGLRSSFASETLRLLSSGLNTLPSHSHTPHFPNSSESCFNATILLRPFLIILFKNFNPPTCFLPLPLSCFVSFSMEGIFVCPRYPPGHAHIHSPNFSALLCFREADLVDSVSRLTCPLAPFWVWPKAGGRRRFERGGERIRDVLS